MLQLGFAGAMGKSAMTRTFNNVILEHFHTSKEILLEKGHWEIISGKRDEVTNIVKFIFLIS